MGKQLLVRYIREVVEAHLARVPDQLVSDNRQEDDDETNELDEFAGVGGIAGYTAPLAGDADRDGRKNKSRK